MSRVMIITGSRKGIGRAMAEHYLAQGWRVAGCSRDESDLKHTCYRHWQLDVADERAVVSMVREIAKMWGGVDCLLNNAGIAAMNHCLTTPMQTVSSVFATNLQGSFLFLREAGKLMIRKKSGRIVNFTTVAVPLNLEGEAVYAASKAAVEALTRIAAKELGFSGVTVNAVGPTPIPTDLIKTVPKQKIERLIEQQAIRRSGEVGDVLNVVDFFLDEKSGFITGQVIYLGGITR